MNVPFGKGYFRGFVALGVSFFFENAFRETACPFQVTFESMFFPFPNFERDVFFF